MPQFLFTKYARKKYEKLDSEIQKRIQRKLESIRKHEHFESLIKQLCDIDDTTYRLRIGDYRIFLEKNNDEQYCILDIDHRSRIYR